MSWPSAFSSGINARVEAVLRVRRTKASDQHDRGGIARARKVRLIRRLGVETSMRQLLQCLLVESIAITEAPDIKARPFLTYD